MHIHFSFCFCSLCVCVCVNGNRVPFFFILCNFIAIFFSAWPSHLARLVLAISKWLCSFFYCYFFSLHVFIYCKLFWARNKDYCCIVVAEVRAHACYWSSLVDGGFNPQSDLICIIFLRLKTSRSSVLACYVVIEYLNATRVKQITLKTNVSVNFIEFF